MSTLPDQERTRLTTAVQTHDFLRRVVRQIERMQRVVFHGHDLAPAKLRASAEEILVADIVQRHRGNFDGVYFSLRAAEDAGKGWDQAIADYAATAHSYYTTPLGLLIRRDLFGNHAHFVSDLAHQLARDAGGQQPEPD